MKIICWFISICLLMMSQVWASTQYLKVATWNTEWLHKYNDHGMVKRSDIDYQRYQDYAKLLDADIIAFQEIDGASAAKRLLSSRDYRFIFSDRNHPQRVGFAVKRSLNITDQRVISEITLNNHRLRKAVEITINWQNQSITFLAVHLKSGCFTDNLTNPNSHRCSLLKSQLLFLTEYLKNKRGTATVVLGDFNRVFSETDYFWQQLKEHGKLYDDGQLHKSHCWQGVYPDYIDHIVLNQKAQAFFVPNSFEQILYLNTDKWFYRLSDHCPISLYLRAGENA